MFFIIYQSKRGNRAGSNPQVFHHTLIRSKRKFPLFELFFQFMNAHLPGMFQDDEVMPVSFVIPEKQVLAMGGIEVLPVFHSFLNGRSRGMFVILKRYFEFVEKLV